MLKMCSKWNSCTLKKKKTQKIILYNGNYDWLKSACHQCDDTKHTILFPTQIFADISDFYNEISSKYWIDFKNHPEAHKTFRCQKPCQIFELQFVSNGSQLELEKCCKHILLGDGESEKSLPAKTTSLRGAEDLSGHTVTTGILRIPTPWQKLLLQIFCASQTYPGTGLLCD